MPRKINQKSYGPAPNPIGGNGGIHTRMLVPIAGVPKRTDAAIMAIVPANIRIKPSKNSLKGANHGKASNGVIGLTRL